MESAAFIGLIATVVIIVGGMFASRAIIRYAYPWRLQMFEIAAEIRSRPNLSRDDRLFVDYCMDNAFSFRAGLIPIFAAVRVIAREFSGKPAPKADPRCPDITRVSQRFMLSVLLANPFALAAFIPLIIVMMIVGRETAKPAIRQTATSLRAAAAC